MGILKKASDYSSRIAIITLFVAALYSSTLPEVKKVSGQIASATSDTIIYRDTCQAFSWQRQADIQLNILVPDEGGTAVLASGETAYFAIYGAAQPHVRTKDDPSIIWRRFIYVFTLNKISFRYRITLYKTGAWSKEIQLPDGQWVVEPMTSPIN